VLVGIHSIAHTTFDLSFLRSDIYNEGISREISRKPYCHYLIGWKTTLSDFGGKNEKGFCEFQCLWVVRELHFRCIQHFPLCNAISPEKNYHEFT